MESSERQFQELMAQLIVRAEKIFHEKDILPPMGLLITEAENVELVVTTEDFLSGMSICVQLIKDKLINRVQEGGVLATCVAYPDYEKNLVIALLENNQNYCCKVVIPVITNGSVQLDVGGIEIDDGSIYIFPQL